MAASGKPAEKEFYEPIRRYLEQAFGRKFGTCYLEVTAGGLFSETLKSAVRDDIIFSFLGRKASPDLAGFVYPQEALWTNKPSTIQDFITVEIKREKIILQDIYQAKMYGDLFQARYALLISPKPIPEEIKRLDRRLFFVTYRYMSGWYLHVGEWDSKVNSMEEYRWLPKSPYK